MHWLAAAAARAGLKGADALVIPPDTGLIDAWEIASQMKRGLPGQLFAGNRLMSSDNSKRGVRH